MTESLPSKATAVPPYVLARLFGSRNACQSASSSQWAELLSLSIESKYLNDREHLYVKNSENLVQIVFLVIFLVHAKISE